MAETTNSTGRLVSVTARAYAGFRDRQGQDMPGGVTYQVWVAPATDQAPFAVKVRDIDAVAALRQLPFGQLIEVLCELRAQDNRIVRTLVAFETVADPVPVG